MIVSSLALPCVQPEGAAFSGTEGETMMALCVCACVGAMPSHAHSFGTGGRQHALEVVHQQAGVGRCRGQSMQASISLPVASISLLQALHSQPAARCTHCASACVSCSGGVLMVSGLGRCLKISGQSLAQMLLSRMQLSTLPKSGSWLNRALQEVQQGPTFSNAADGLCIIVCSVRCHPCFAARHNAGS